MNIRNILSVYTRDIKSIIKNPIALGVVLGLCILPSLYAWVNIKACWDPYSNTSNIPVAVVNQDTGGEFNGKQENVGQQMVENLKTNHSLGWKFVSKQDAESGIIDGTYYAAVEIPKNFTAGFVGISSGNTKKPQLIYKINTKANPVANKINEVAENSLSDQLSATFVSNINATVFSILNKIGAQGQGNQKNIINLKDDILQINKNMNLITDSLQSVNRSSINLSDFLAQLNAAIPEDGQYLTDMQSNNAENRSTIASTKTTINSSLDTIGNNLVTASAEATRLQSLAKQLNGATSTANTAFINSAFQQIDLSLDNLNSLIGEEIDYLQSVNNQSPNANITSMIANLKSIQSSLSSEKNNSATLRQGFLSANKINTGIANTLVDDFAQTNQQLISASQNYNSRIRPELNSICDNLIAASDDASALISASQGLNQQIAALMTTAQSGAQLSASTSNDLRTKLLDYKELISSLSDKLQMVNNNDIYRIISILQSNPQLMGSYVSSPFNLKEVAVYGVPNYGSAMAPLYTVLSLWVGTLLLASVLKTEPPDFPGIENISIRERFIGKMFTFATLSILQALIDVTGDEVLLGVYTVNLPLIYAFGIVSSLVFIVITYTLVSVFGNLGKCLSVIYLIVQLAGSGGSYPIQLDAAFFRICQPFMPFTYSLGGFREAIAGPLQSGVIVDFACLTLFGIAFGVFGFLAKKPLHTRVRKFETEFEESGVGD